MVNPDFSFLYAHDGNSLTMKTEEFSYERCGDLIPEWFSQFEFVKQTEAFALPVGPYNGIRKNLAHMKMRLMFLRLVTRIYKLAQDEDGCWLLYKGKGHFVIAPKGCNLVFYQE